MEEGEKTGTTLALTGTIALAIPAIVLLLMNGDLLTALAVMAIAIPLWATCRTRCPACGEIVGDKCHGDDCKAKPPDVAGRAGVIGQGCLAWMLGAIVTLVVVVLVIVVILR